jgi:hypothetical protein
MFAPEAEHPKLYDVKQLGFYMGCLGKATSILPSRKYCSTSVLSMLSGFPSKPVILLTIKAIEGPCPPKRGRRRIETQCREAVL